MGETFLYKQKNIMHLGNKQKWIIILPSLLGFLLALVSIFIVGVNKVSFPDAPDYLIASKSILKDFSYPRQGLFPFYRPPLYSFFISLIWLVFQDSIAAVKIAQAILHGLTCWFIYKTVFEIFKNKKLGILCSLICAVHPLLLFQAAEIQTETLHTLLIAVVVFLMAKILYQDKISFPLALTLGFVFGVAALCRPSALPIGIIIIFTLFILKAKKVNLKLSLLAMIIAASGLFIAILPWTFYNKATTGEWILISDAGGYSFWVGNVPQALDFYEGNFSSARERMDFSNYIYIDFTRQKISEWETEYGYSKLSLKERENLWQKEAIENLKDNPRLTLKLWLLKCWFFWRPYLYPEAYSLKIVLASAIFLVPLYLLAIYSLVRLYRESRHKKFVIVMIIYFLSVTGLHMLIIGMIRYRVPYIDPYLSMFAGIGLVFLLPAKFQGFFLTKENQDLISNSLGNKHSKISNEIFIRQTDF